MKRKHALQALVALALVWTSVWAIARVTTAALPSAERLLSYIAQDPLQTRPRAEVVEHVIHDYVRLSFPDKRALRAREAQGAFDSFLNQLTLPEKARFLEGVTPAGFRELLAGFSKMQDRDKMKALDRSKREILENLGDSPVRLLLEQATPQMLKQIADGGLANFYDALPPEAKLQMLPFIEQMQNNIRQLRD